jgi:hypothetical protein
MDRAEPQVLHGRDVPEARSFTDVAKSLDDLAFLRRIGADLWRWLQVERPDEDSFRVGGDLEGGPWQHVVVRAPELRAGGPIVVVGFCGLQRPDAPRERLIQADEEMIDEFPSQPHILSYSTFGRPSGRFDNLVCFRELQGLDDWRENEVHATRVRELAHLSYQLIRLHRGEAPAGLAHPEQLRLRRTGYYDYSEAPPWVGVREYPEGLTGEDAGA